MSRWLLALLVIGCLFEVEAVAQPSEKPDRVAQLVANAKKLVAVDADGCLATSNPNEIVVCSAFDANRKHRLPIPELAADPGKRIRVPLPNGNAEIVQGGRCYVTMNERNCFKGVPLMTVSFGGNGGGVGGPAGRLWRVIEPPIPDEDYVKQAKVRPLEDPVP